MVELTFGLCASIADLDAAFALYLDHGGDWLPVPDPDDLFDAMGDRRLVGCWSEDRLVAVGGTFAVARCRDPGGPTIQVYELAGMVIAPAFRGWRLHRMLVMLRAFLLALEQYQHIALIASVAGPNIRSRVTMERMDLVRVDDRGCPSWLREVRRTWLPGAAPAVDDFILPAPALSAHIGWLNAIRDVGIAHGSDPNAWCRCLFTDDIWDAARGPLPDLSPDWCAHVPTVRLIGREPPFHPWPR